MTGEGLIAYEIVDPKKKDGVWADNVIQAYRRMERSLVTQTRMFTDRSILYSVQELNDVKESFDDEDFKKRTKFLPLPILEPMLNSVVEDIIKNPPKTELRAIDPEANDDRKEDIELLTNRNIIENDRTQLQQAVGLPKYSVSNDEYNGNVEEFDNLGLDESDPDDVNFYKNDLQKLNYEIAGQAVITACQKNSRFNKTVARKLTKDIFAAKIVVTQQYVDKISGEIKQKYIDPQYLRGVFGTANDGTDDVWRSTLQPVTIMEFLQMVGNDFDFAKHWRYLLWAINYCNARQFTGFIRNNSTFDCCGNTDWMTEMGMDGIITPNLLDWNLAYTFKIYLGYGEWRSPEVTSTFLTNRNDKNFAEQINFNYELKKKQIKEGYEKVSKYQVPWYCSWFIATTAVSQWIFSYGKIYFQTLHGANDEYSNGTISYWQEEGLSAVEISRPYLQMANFTFYHMLWIIYKAQPDKEEYVYEELIQLAGKTQRQFPQATPNAGAPDFQTIINDLISQMRKKHVRIRTYPKIEGRAVQQIYPIEKKGSGGMDPIAMSMQAVTMWAEENIALKIGINPMRLGQNPPSRESTRSEQRSIDYSLSTTGYMYRMIQYLKEHSAVTILNFAQDIVKYKDSVPYKWLLKVIGNENVKCLKNLDKFAAHRYGMYIDDYNSDLDKKDIKDAATIALTEGSITFNQWFTITQTDDPKKAAKLLGHYELKKKKDEQQAEMDKLQAADDFKANEHKRLMDQMKFTRGTEWGKAEITARSVVAAAQIQAKGRIDVKELEGVEEPGKIAAKTEAQKDLETHKAALKKEESSSAV